MNDHQITASNAMMMLLVCDKRPFFMFLRAMLFAAVQCLVSILNLVKNINMLRIFHIPIFLKITINEC